MYTTFIRNKRMFNFFRIFRKRQLLEPMEIPIYKYESHTYTEAPIYKYESHTYAEEPKRLTGPELLAKVDELTSKGVSKKDLAIACGYVKYKRNGEILPSFTEFYEQLLISRGVDLGLNSPIGKEGRKLSYRATVQGNGNLLIGKAYTSMMNLDPGDQFEIKLGKKFIRLVPVESAVDHINNTILPDE